MKFGYTILYVPNVDEALTFYQQAFGFKRKMLHGSGGYGELESGETTLGFADFAGMKELGKNPIAAKANAPSFELAFTTDNVAEAVEAAVAAGAKLVSEPADMPWGQTIAYVADINGFLVELCTPIQP